jgi:hypothetical protein
MRVFLDANVGLDVLAHREPYFSDSVQVLSLVESRAVEGLIAAHTVTTLFSLLESKSRCRASEIEPLGSSADRRGRFRGPGPDSSGFCNGLV